VGINPPRLVNPILPQIPIVNPPNVIPPKPYINPNPIILPNPPQNVTLVKPTVTTHIPNSANTDKNDVAIKSLISMGFPRKLIMECIQQTGLDLNTDLINAEVILDLILSKNIDNNPIEDKPNPPPTQDNIRPTNPEPPKVVKEDPPKQDDEDESVCVVCWENLINTVCIPCGHLALCIECSPTFENKECPICRAKLLQIIKTYKFLTGYKL